MTQFITPNLPYEYNALEPYIDEATMRIHHDKHHAAYTTNLNKALEKYPEYFEQNIEDILININNVPDDVRQAVKNAGGGHWHHSLLWLTIRPGQNNNQAQGSLLEKITNDFGSWENFKKQMTETAMTVFGSGWAWLSMADDKLIIEKTANQDSPLSLGHLPLFGIDTWEHAYYLKYQNRRLEYIENYWAVINWEGAQRRFDNHLTKK